MSLHGLNFNRREIPENVLAEPDYLSKKPDAQIWRYMELWKFKLLLQSKSLYLANHNTFDDPFEGSFPKNYSETRDYIKKRYGLLDSKEETIHKLQKKLRKYTYVNCWHVSNYESAAMWHIYGKGNKSIAIQSTYGKLLESISAHKNLLVAGVAYIDYETDEIPFGNLLFNFLFKRQSFDYEKELRILFLDQKSYDEENKPEEGKKFEVDLNKFIDNIYVAPFCDDKFIGLVKSELESHSVPLAIKRSELDKSPFS